MSTLVATRRCCRVTRLPTRPRWLIVIGVGCHAAGFAAAFLLPRATRAGSELTV